MHKAGSASRSVSASRRRVPKVTRGSSVITDSGQVDAHNPHCTQLSSMKLSFGRSGSSRSADGRASGDAGQAQSAALRHTDPAERRPCRQARSPRPASGALAASADKDLHRHVPLAPRRHQQASLRRRRARQGLKPVAELERIVGLDQADPPRPYPNGSSTAVSNSSSRRHPSRAGAAMSRQQHPHFGRPERKGPPPARPDPRPAAPEPG